MNVLDINTNGYGVSMIDGQYPYVFNQIYNTKESAIDAIVNHISHSCNEDDINYVRRTLEDFGQAKVNDKIFMLSKLDVPGRLYNTDMDKDKDKEMPVIMLSSNDIYELGYDASGLTDVDMFKIAEKVSEQLMPDYWTILEDLLRTHKVPRLLVESDEED